VAQNSSSRSEPATSSSTPAPCSARPCVSLSARPCVSLSARPCVRPCVFQDPLNPRGPPACHSLEGGSNTLPRVTLRGGRVRLHRNVQRFRGGLAFKAHRLCISLNSRRESNNEEDFARVLVQEGFRFIQAAQVSRAGTGYQYFTEMCSGSEAGSYSRLVDFVYHSTLGLSVITKKKKTSPASWCKKLSARLGGCYRESLFLMSEVPLSLP